MSKDYTRTEVALLNAKIKEAQSKINSLQSTCPHETSVYSAHGSTGHWDRDDSYWYDFYCYDCGKRWSHEQSLGHGTSMEVKKIDYSEDVRAIELQMELKSLKRSQRVKTYTGAVWMKVPGRGWIAVLSIGVNTPGPLINETVAIDDHEYVVMGVERSWLLTNPPQLSSEIGLLIRGEPRIAR